MGTRKHNEVQMRWSATAKPALGGLSFYIVFLLAFIFLELITQGSAGFFSNIKMIGLLFALSLAFLMGLADDAFDTKPLAKFIIQCLCGIILISTGTKINTFESEFLNYGFTIFWLVAMMNSINMLDNMDAVSSMVSLAICFFVLLTDFESNTEMRPMTLLSICIAGTLSGFLIYNWHPSKMFMGDSGSQFLGVFLAFCGIEYCWNAPYVAEKSQVTLYPLHSFVLVALVFAMPLIDTAVVCINRISKGSSPFVGGKDHTTHHLFYNGVTEKKTALLFLAINTVGGLLTRLYLKNFTFSVNTSLLFALYPFFLFAFFLYLTKRKRHEKAK
ncbi:MAG: undecaprenyl/decaprenyl-phosphate alpha-N-acetylglucosaminyl 1-phosphate transferase [Bacteroidetes bacterium]|nr:undecaprenyl/decaprenyl-phosphate alpha-N-acetylglucosaminyl 1-phosphate transferase [Bacteroidota bacterium]